MKAGFVVAVMALSTSTGTSSRPVDSEISEAQQIVRAAAADEISADLKAGHRVCVQHELEPALENVRSSLQNRSNDQPDESLRWFAGKSPADVRIARRLEFALKTAASGKASNGPIATINRLSAPVTIFSKKRVIKKCDPSRIFEATPGSPVIVILSRPAMAGGYAFVEVGGVCGALCGSGFVKAFEKRSGRWVQVASKFLWVS